MSIHSAAEPAAHAHAHPSPHPTPATVDEPRRPWTVFGLMIAAQFMVILDVSVVNVALPSISRACTCPPRTTSGRSAPTCCSPAACCCSAAASPTC